MAVALTDLASLPVTISNGSSTDAPFIGQVGGKTVVVSGTITRPADTNAYAVNDVVADSTSAAAPVTLSGAARIAGGSGYISKIRLWTSNKTTTNAVFRLWIYNSSSITMPGQDNAAFAQLWANRTYGVGYVDIALTTEDSTASDAAGNQIIQCGIPFVCATASTALYAVLEAKAAYTPASGQVFYVELTVEQN